MKLAPFALRAWLPVMAALLIVLTGAPIGSTGATASSIAVLVNDQPITDYDIAQRQRLLQATSGGQGGGRQEAINELIDERQKMQAARRVGATASKAEVDAAFGAIATRVGLSTEQFAQALGQIGVNADSLKNRLEADLAWRNVVRSQLRQDVRIRERDIDLAIAKRGPEAQAQAYELLLQQVIFVVPSGSSAQYTNQRRQDAQAFRSRFTGCDSTRELARSFRDTVVKDPIRRNSTALPPQMRESLQNVGIGQMTQPNDTENAIELIAVCDRQETNERSGVRQEIESELINEQGERLARRLLIDLKQVAVIEYR